jgi:hypothetical protein
MSDERILDKIKKCLALSASSNEHESQAALRQAKKLMEIHGINDQDVLASQAQEARARSAVKATPTIWESALARLVADAFGCEHLFIQGGWTSGSWAFVGCGAAPDVASYAFTVLLRQCKRSRDAYMSTTLRRCGRTNKVARADLFCRGWVDQVRGTVSAFTHSAQQRQAIGAFIESKYGSSLGPLKPADRHKGKGLSATEFGDMCAGSRSGKSAQLHHGVAGSGAPLALEDRS